MFTDSPWAWSLSGLEFTTISLKLCLLQAPTLRITFFRDPHHLHARWFFPCWSELSSEILFFCHLSYLLRGDYQPEKPRGSKAGSLGVASSSCHWEALSMKLPQVSVSVRTGTHLISEIHSASKLTLQESEIGCIRPMGTLCFRGTSADGVLPCRLSLHALLFRAS